jgi:endogenous inhibitor of DNA gyrase (YacG/DUF329 family)
MSAELPLCTYCGKAPRVPEWTPFCSKGCADRDLLHWLKESYALPGETPLDSEDEPV